MKHGGLSHQEAKARLASMAPTPSRRSRSSPSGLGFSASSAAPSSTSCFSRCSFNRAPLL